MTVKLYDTDPYLKEFGATVLSCKKTDDGYVATLDKTAFFPEEGGQKCDTGKIGDATVYAVTIKDDTLYHYTDLPVKGNVSCTIDFDARLDKMRQHTGEHILSGVIHSLFGLENVGFHLGDDDVTCDFNGPLSQEQLDRAELEANRAVFANRAVHGYYPDKEKLKTLDYRSKSGIEGKVRIVEIEGVDFCACCAPHVAHTGEVGIIKITDAISYKGGMRLHIACGERALADYRTRYNSLLYISKALSASEKTVCDNFDKYTKEMTALRGQLSDIKKTVIQLKTAAVEKTEGSIVIFEQDADMTLLRQYVNALYGKYGRVCAVISGADDALCFNAASDCIDMREVAKTLKCKFNAKGGGSDKMIQGTVPCEIQKLQQFFEEL